MAYAQIIPPKGDIDNQPATQYRKLEDLPGALRLLDAMLIELYAGAGGGSGGAGGTLVSNTPGAGAITGYAPGITLTTDRLDVVADSSGTQLNDLTAGLFDGQRIRVRNTGAADLVLVSENAGSTAANRFKGVGDVTIIAGDSVDIVYYAGSVSRWVM